MPEDLPYLQGSLSIQNKVGAVFRENFGRTPLGQRLDDIVGEAIELRRWSDFDNLREELGDLICSSIQLANELGIPFEDLVDATLEKINRRSAQYRSLGRKITVALLGGAFNPPTLGHIEIAKYVLGTSRTFDEVWLMPCYGHMFGKEMESPEHRLAMCQIATRNDPRIKVFDYEIANQLSSETYQTMKLLMATDMAHHQFDFSLIIGMDNANKFHEWVNYQHLERLVRFVVVPRKGYTMDPKADWYLKPPHIFLGHSEYEIREVSSTEVRNALHLIHNMKGYEGHEEEIAHLACYTGGPNVEGLLDREVFRYIIENGLYGMKKGDSHGETLAREEGSA